MEPTTFRNIVILFNLTLLSLTAVSFVSSLAEGGGVELASSTSSAHQATEAAQASPLPPVTTTTTSNNRQLSNEDNQSGAGRTLLERPTTDSSSSSNNSSRSSAASYKSSIAPTTTTAITTNLECPTCGSGDLNCDNVHRCTNTCGKIKSINYPSNYGNNHRCRWSIRAPNGHYVNLSIIDFDIPSANNATILANCIFDHLTLIDGYSGKRLGCYCNENLPPPSIVSPWNELIIQFDTNSETTGRGFYFQYQFMRLELSERIQRQLKPTTIDHHNEAATTGSNSQSAATAVVGGGGGGGGGNLGTAATNYRGAKMTKGAKAGAASAMSTAMSDGPGSAAQVCRNGWQYFRGSCYRAYNEQEPLQWHDAENKCKAYGIGLDGHLLSILDKDEALFILYMLNDVWKSARYLDYYIGLIDASREGIYRWSDKNPMSYTDWELKSMLLEEETPAQPDGGAYEDCTVIRYNSFSRTSNWHDVPCSLGKHYHSHLEKSNAQVAHKWDYVSSYICKSDRISKSTFRRPLYSNEFKPSIQSGHLIRHLSRESTSGGGVGVSVGAAAAGGSEPMAASPSPTGPAGPSTTPVVADEHLTFESSAAVATTPLAPPTTHSMLLDSSVGVEQPTVAADENSSSLATTTSGSADQSHSSLLNKKNRFYLSMLDDNRYFVCDNLEVISVVLRCDGDSHCRDGSDETHSCDQDCLDWQFKCANGRCISIGNYCDFLDQCGDGSDESRCERHRCKKNEFKCQSGQCISAHQRCDLLPDCHDLSDEGRLCTSGNCNSASTFQCYNGNCIPQYAVCDFQIDCPGKFHEDENAATCDLVLKSRPLEYSLFSGTLGGNRSGTNTTSSSSSSSASLVVPVVGHNSSTMAYQLAAASQVESNPGAAAVWLAKQNLFRCNSGNLIDNDLRCLYEFDPYGYQIGCRDVSHLTDCADFECPSRDYVKCSDSYCIPWRYICDGKWDCIMGEDEVHCARYVCPGQYKCANNTSCILLHQLCDGQRQCPMGDDEWFCDLRCPAQCDCIGQSVNCHGANLSSLPQDYISKSVRKLDLSYNNLGPNLSTSDFSAYHDLGELILNHNKIEVLIPRKFNLLRNLYKLDLSNNQIHSVKRGAFAGLRRVTQLLLESNPELVILEPEAFLGLSSLQILNISSSRIHALRKNTFDGLTSLRHLLLRSNMIVEIEDGAFRSLNSLISLDMRGNEIRTFTKVVFNDLKSLRNLSTDSFKFCCLVNQQIPADRCLPLPDEISDCEDLLSSVLQRTCIWIAGVVACAGNFIVIWYRLAKYRHEGPKEREEEQVNSTLLLSLGASDLLMGVYLIIIASMDLSYRGIYIENVDNWRKSVLCNLCGFLSTVSSEKSIFTLVLIAHNRYTEICHPFKTGFKFTLGWTIRLLAIAWLLALIIASLPLLVHPYFKGMFYARSGVCLAFHLTNQKAAGWEYSIVVFLCLRVVAFTWIIICYKRIYTEIRLRAACAGHHAERPNPPVKIALVVMTHFAAWFPTIIMECMSLAGYALPMTAYSWIAVLVMPVNSAINPMIYTIPNIRQHMRRIIRNHRAGKSGSLVAATRPLNSLAPLNHHHSGLSNGHHQQTTKEILPLLTAPADLRQRLAQRNVPPGYTPLKQFIRPATNPAVTAEHLVKIALEIARDIEEKHREAKVYASLGLDNVFVSDKIVPDTTDESVGVVGVPTGDSKDGNENEDDGANDTANETFRLDCLTKRPSTPAVPSSSNRPLSVFLADYDGYRIRRASCSSQHYGPLSSSALQHSYRHHKTLMNCECSDVGRFGDILFKLVQLYNTGKLEQSEDSTTTMVTSKQ